MKKKNDKSPVEAYKKKRFDMSDKELGEAIKNMTDEELVRIFIAMLKEDINKAGYLFQHLKEVINSSAAMGREGYHPIAMFTLYARESMGLTEFKFRSARTGSEELYLKFNLKLLGELINDAWVRHGNEVFGGLTKESEVDMSVLDAWAKAAEDQEEKVNG